MLRLRDIGPRLRELIPCCSRNAGFRNLGPAFFIITLNDVKYLDLKMFQLSPRTEDDPFVLMTALHLGPGARILSNDVMRQHHYALSSLTENG